MSQSKQTAGTKWTNYCSKQKKTNSWQRWENEQPLPSAGIHATVVERKKARESLAEITFVSTSDWLKKLHVYSNLLAHMAQILKPIKRWAIPKFMEKHSSLQPVSVINCQISRTLNSLLRIVNKHLMTGPKGNTEFCFPKILNVEGTLRSRETKLTISRGTSH